MAGTCLSMISIVVGLRYSAATPPCIPGLFSRGGVHGGVDRMIDGETKKGGNPSLFFAFPPLIANTRNPHNDPQRAVRHGIWQ